MAGRKWRVEVCAAYLGQVGGWSLCFSSTASHEKQNVSCNSSSSGRAVNLFWFSVTED